MLLLPIVSLGGLECKFGSEARQWEEKEQEWDTVHIEVGPLLSESVPAP